MSEEFKKYQQAYEDIGARGMYIYLLGQIDFRDANADAIQEFIIKNCQEYILKNIKKYAGDQG